MTGNSPGLADVCHIPRRPGDIERWLQASELAAAAAAGRPITPGTEKLVVWNGGAPCRTDVALVFIHGYTGCRQSCAPVLEQVAGRLDANLFCTRLTGSGLGEDAIGAVMAFSNLSQPLFGLFGDRLRRRNLVPVGVLLAAVCMPLMGVTESFALTLAVIAAGGLGVAAFHPQSFVIAADLSGARRAFGIALFVFAGTVGLATTPTWLTFTVAAFGTRVLPLATLPGVVAALAIWRWVPLSAGRVEDQDWRAVGTQLAASLRPLAAILAVVVLIGMSTGASLAASEVADNPSVAALVMLAPNFWPRNRGVSLLLTPAGPLLARLLVGRYRDLSGHNEMEDRYWTTRHDSRSLIPMMQAVRDARRAALEAIRCPALVVYTEQDKVVSVAEIKAAYARLGSPCKQLLDLPGADCHELAGTVHAPAMTPVLTAAVTRFLNLALR
jgi:pimeloyl-ACP methyl ester carboxylesterase